MSMTKLRAWWAQKQGLLKESTSLSPEEVFKLSGWCRSVAGANPYLTAFSRARLTRDRMDSAVKDLEISELPAARGCTYVVSRDQFAVALACGASSNGSSEYRIALQLGATSEELDLLADKVLEALKTGTKDPQTLRQELGPVVRNFGEAGKKKGLTTSLPIALGDLQSKGKIVRRPVSGRLDDQRYAYELWGKNPPKMTDLTSEDALKELAEQFYKWIGPASLADFAVLAGLSGKGARAATGNLDLIAIEGTELLILAEEKTYFDEFQTPDEPVYRLISCLDSSILLHSDYSSLFNAAGFSRCLEIQGKPSGSVLKELGFNAIVDRGTVVGLWEFDPDRKEVVYACLEPVAESLKEEVSLTQNFIADQLGDARTFSLDSPKSRQPKLEKLKLFQ